MADTSALANLEVGMKLHAKYEKDGEFYAATVLQVSKAKKRAKASVRVDYNGWGDAWLSLDMLKSKALGLNGRPAPKAKAKSKSQPKDGSRPTKPTSTVAKGACPWATESVAFKRWVQDAVTRNAAEREELYAFLTECSVDADTDRDGLVNAEEFDFLIEKAAALPRRFGLAPGWKALYGDIASRQAGRAKLFKTIDEHKKNTIGIDDWIQYAFKHIAEKVKTMPMRSLDFENLQASGKGHFLRFLKVAVSSTSSSSRTSSRQTLTRRAP